MTDIRLKWEPDNGSSQDLVFNQVSKYMDNEATFAVFPNGSCLMLKEVDSLDQVIKGAISEARRIKDFKVYPMEDGDYLVFFASPLLVYVGKQEFEEKKNEIIKRFDDLLFPSEEFIDVNNEKNYTNLLIGLYARGKLQHDAWGDFSYTIKS